MRTFLLGCVSLLIPLALYAQTPVADLLTAVADETAPASARWTAALDLGAATFADAAEQQTAVDALGEALRAREVGLRVNAATALGRIGDASGVAALADGIGDRQPVVRRAVAHSLGRIGTEASALALLTRVDDADGAVRGQVIHALGETGEPVAVGALGGIFLSHNPAKDGAFTREATRALLKMGGFAVDTFAAGLASHDADKQLISARALGLLGDPRAAEPLMRVLGALVPSVAAAAESALAHLGEPAMPGLIEALDAENPSVHGHALAAITDMGSPAVPTLVDLYTTSMLRVTELEGELQALADAIAQAEAASKAAVVAAQQPPPPPDPSTMTVSEIQREAKGLKKQLRVLNDEHDDIDSLVVYRRAANTFNQWIDAGRRELNKPPAPAATALSQQAAPSAEVAIGPEAQSSAAIASTQRALEDELDDHRARAHDAVVALGQIGDDVAVTTLSGVALTGAVMEATLAADALGRTGNANAVGTLTGLIADVAAPSSVRANAARGLGTLGATQAQAALQQLADTDPAPNVRRAAQQALHRLAPTVSLSPTG
ncbi:hypothetical protein CMK11_04815 [Candidatus Poribacteria bacterium]|nr:hypothetical protein [Candidatus Poribacteria bacterium]